ncbi:MAG: hypothetical protein H6978_12390 [Gammaproteobacteria bacterium]|nr:hypothetical protein [Gammaproteobacteria bacterium]
MAGGPVSALASPGSLLTTAASAQFTLFLLLGLCPLLALTRRPAVARDFALMLLLVAPPAVLLAKTALRNMVLPNGVEYLTVPGLVCIAMFSVTGVGALLDSVLPGYGQRLRAFQPLLLLNCTLLGVMLVAAGRNDDVASAVFDSFALVAGYGILLVAISHLRGRLDAAMVPAPFRGVPVLLISIGIVAMAAYAFTGG